MPKRITVMDVTAASPLKSTLKGVESEMKFLGEDGKHVYIGGERAIAMAVKLLTEKKIIAVPTDTIYGVTSVISSRSAVGHLYE